MNKQGEEALKDLAYEALMRSEYNRDSKIGLWATDRPDLIPEDIKHLFWELKDECL